MKSEDQRHMNDYERTYELVKMLSIIKVRPSLYFKEGSYYEQLLAFLQGFSFCTHFYDGGDTYSWSSIENYVWEEVKQTYGQEEFECEDDAMKFMAFIDIVVDVFKEMFPDW